MTDAARTHHSEEESPDTPTVEPVSRSNKKDVPQGFKLVSIDEWVWVDGSDLAEPSNSGQQPLT